MIKKFDKELCLSLAAVALLSGGLIWLAAFWQFGKIREISDNIQKEQLDSLVREQRSQKILELGKEFKNVEADQGKMNAMFVDKENAVPFLATLENIATSTDNLITISVIDLTKLKSQTAKKPVVQDSDEESSEGQKKESQPKKTPASQGNKQDFSNQLGFSVELTGRYGALVDFLTKLENMPYFAKVYSFKIAPTEGKQAGQTGESGAPPASNQESQIPPPQEENKNLNTTLIIGVYTNGTK
ncbi:MAG: hypothetical protein A3J76_04700 [Candidatus Moranbacteria bacterium RBG_13_45_13]|nr:MAG: hypothetical protein A3J76_04700 [Candidatus Moranbacteria bacterium RBG_13_45_13]